MERFNRRYILFAVVGAGGLALGVDKFFLSDGLTSPKSASASQAAPGAVEATPASKVANAVNQVTVSPAAKLTAYRKSNANAIAASNAGASIDAMAYPAWAASKVDRAATPAGMKYKDTFVLSGVARDSVRLRREGDAHGMERGRVLRIGDQVAWSAESGVSVRLVSISPDKASAIIEVDGEPRELARTGTDLTDSTEKSPLSPLSTIRVEKAPEKPAGNK